MVVVAHQTVDRFGMKRANNAHHVRFGRVDIGRRTMRRGLSQTITRGHHGQPEPIVGGPRKLGQIEKTVLGFGQPAGDEKPEEGNRGAGENRHFKRDGDKGGWSMSRAAPHVQRCKGRAMVRRTVWGIRVMMCALAFRAPPIRAIP